MPQNIFKHNNKVDENDFFYNCYQINKIKFGYIKNHTRTSYT